MAEKGETRDPSSHRTPGQITRKNHGYDAKPENIKARANNNKARAMLAKEGKVHKGDGKDVHHIKPQRSGGSTARSNLAVKSAHENRGWEKKK
jgi:hypothetical protein